MKTFINAVLLLILVVTFGCKEDEKEKPKVTYKESPAQVEVKKDTTQIKIADLINAIPIILNITCNILNRREKRV